MRLKTYLKSVAIFMLLLQGCVNNSTKVSVKQNTLDAFDIVFKDAKRSDCLPVDWFYATGYVNYILPESVQNILKHKELSTLKLKSLSDSGRPDEKELALVCLKLLRAKQIETCYQKTVSGVKLFCYTIPAQKQ